MNYQEQISNLIAKNVFSEGFYNILKEKYNDLEILCFVYKEYLNVTDGNINEYMNIDQNVFLINHTKIKKYVGEFESNDSVSLDIKVSSEINYECEPINPFISKK